jgi:two-component system chemotaxis response regulator CheB
MMSGASKQIRVLVVDDSTFMRSALVRMVERDPRFTVVGIATNGQEGVEKAKELRPDVMTLDIEMPIMNGIEALKQIMATTKTPVIMVSTLTEAGAKVTLEALEIGAVDFIPKALNDKSNNIFKGAETLHDKLWAAAHTNGAPAALAAPVAPAVAAPPASQRLERFDGRVVLIGSSTGGPKALAEVLKQLPANLKVPVVVAQHMPPQFTTILAARLDETCPLKVIEAADGQTLAAGTVYIAPGGQHMRLEAGVLRIAADAGESPYKPSVDVLAESVRRGFGKTVLAVMLTGMGNDGTREFVNIKNGGGYVLAQDAATSVVYSMPKAVAEAGAVHEVLPLHRIGQRIRELLGA